MFITDCATIKNMRSWKRLRSVVLEEGPEKHSHGGCKYDKDSSEEVPYPFSLLPSSTAGGRRPVVGAMK